MSEEAEVIEMPNQPTPEEQQQGAQLNADWQLVTAACMRWDGDAEAPRANVLAAHGRVQQFLVTVTTPQPAPNRAALRAAARKAAKK